MKNGKTSRFYLGLLLAAVSLGLYWRTGAHPFVVFDDGLYVAGNARVQGGLSPEGVAWAFTTTETGNWHPLTWMSHMADVSLFGLDAGAHHRVNAFLHAANAALLFFVLLRMTASPWRSAFAAALFALHPLHVESVAWVAERKDLLCALFWLLAMGSYARYAGRPGAARYLPVAGFMALALLSKPMAVTLPFCLLLLDFWPLGRLSPPGKGGGAPLPRLLAEKVPLFALSAASCVVTYLAQQTVGTVGSLLHLPAGVRLANAAVSYARYLGKTAWPSGLAVLYPHPGASLPAWQVAGAVLLLLCVSALAVWRIKRSPFLAVGWFWFLGTLVPVIGLVQVGAQAMADRYTYIPLVGLFIAAAWGVPGIVPDGRLKKRGLAAAACVVLTALAAASWVQAGHWRSSVALFEHAVEVTRDNWFAENNLGFSLDMEGRKDEAIAHYRASIGIKPDFPVARNNLGAILAAQGEFAEAAVHFREALRAQPDYLPAHYNLGQVLERMGMRDQAMIHHREVLRLRSGGGTRSPPLNWDFFSTR